MATGQCTGVLGQDWAVLGHADSRLVTLGIMRDQIDRVLHVLAADAGCHRSMSGSPLLDLPEFPALRAAHGSTHIWHLAPRQIVRRALDQRTGCSCQIENATRSPAIQFVEQSCDWSPAGRRIRLEWWSHDCSPIWRRLREYPGVPDDLVLHDRCRKIARPRHFDRARAGAGTGTTWDRDTRRVMYIFGKDTGFALHLLLRPEDVSGAVEAIYDMIRDLAACDLAHAEALDAVRLLAAITKHRN